MNQKRGGVHFKIINGKIRGREMQSVECLVFGVHLLGGSRIATEPYIRLSGYNKEGR